jgi:natural product biosynthesis luciferase-like monooxygenase protein
VQRELPIWVTAAQSDESFRRTGAIGAGLLTHMFDQDVPLLAEKIELYKKARRDHGHDPDGGRVGVALHTFIASDEAEVRSIALPAYARYLKANVGMLKNFADSRGRRIDVSTLSGQDLEDGIGYLFDKFLADRSLLGTVESCEKLVRKLAAIGVHETACLVDFGPEPEAIRGGLENLCRLAGRFAQSTPIASSV